MLKFIHEQLHARTDSYIYKLVYPFMHVLALTRPYVHQNIRVDSLPMIRII